MVFLLMIQDLSIGLPIYRLEIISGSFLGYIKNLCEDVSERIDRGIYKSQQEKNIQRNDVSR